MIVHGSVTQYNLTRLHPGSLYSVELIAIRGEHRPSISTKFKTGTSVFFWQHRHGLSFSHGPPSIHTFRHPEVPLPHRLYTGVAERHPHFRRGGDLPSGEARNADDGLLRHGDRWRRLDCKVPSLRVTFVPKVDYGVFIVSKLSIRLWVCFLWRSSRGEKMVQRISTEAGRTTWKDLEIWVESSGSVRKNNCNYNHKN